MSKFDEMPEQERERLRRHANRLKASTYPYLMWKEGGWKIGAEDVTDSDTWMAVPDLAVIGRYLFIDGRVAEAHTYFMHAIDGDPPRPNTFTDREKWPKGTKGFASDPWSVQSTLFLVDTDNGKIVEFKGSTVDTTAAIGAIMEDFATNSRRQIVALRAVDNPKGGVMPSFEILDYSDDDGDIPGLHVVLRDDTPVSDKPIQTRHGNGGGGDMNDNIPF